MPSDAVSITTSITEDINVTVDYIDDSTGYNTDCAIVAGAQTGVTQITVDDGAGGSHTMQVGQTAYFFDSSSSAFVEREITAVDSTTITIDGANVNVSDNEVISNNLRVNIYRTASGGTLFKLVTSLANDSFETTAAYRDGTADASLGATFLDGGS